MPKASRLPEAEFFYREGGQGRREDELLHEPILAEGDLKAAAVESRKVAREIGLSDEEIDALMGVSKSWRAAKTAAEETLARTRAFDPSQPRDEHGRWTETGAGEDGGGGKEPAAPKPAAVPDYKPGVKANGTAQAKKVKAEWVEESPIQTLDQVVKVAPAAQTGLNGKGKRIAEKLDVELKLPPGGKEKTATPKGIARTKEKADARNGKIAAVTDVFRATFVIDRPEKADQVIAELGKDYQVLAESWRTTPENYTDRAVLVRDPSGMIGEVQIMDPGMYAAKERMHPLYEESRSLKDDNPRKQQLNEVMRAEYAQVRDSYDADWKAVVGNGGS